MSNTPKSVITEKQNEIAAIVVEAQNRIKAKMFGHGMIKAVSDKTGISKYRIRTAITGDNPSIEVLDAIEKALTKLSKAA